MRLKVSPYPLHIWRDLSTYFFTRCLSHQFSNHDLSIQPNPVIIPWYWHLQYIGVLWCNQASPIASHRPFSWCQASTSLHDPFSPGLSTATEAALSPVVFHGLSQCQASAALHDPFMPSKPVPPGWLLHSTKSSHSTKYNCGYLWNILSVLSENTSKKISSQWCWSLLNHC